ncbi:hypothetical protein SAMN02745127_02788, partial [Oceanospirillum multiglobuliferum]
CFPCQPVAYLRATFWPVPRLSRSLGSLFFSNKALFYLLFDALATITPRAIPKALNTLLLIKVSVHRHFRKLTKTKGGFANENALLKLLYAGMLKASEKWTHSVQNWNVTLSQLSIHFEVLPHQRNV